MTRPEPAAVLCVSLVHLRPGHVFEARLQLPASATVADAIAASGLFAAVPELARQPLLLGVFGQRRALTDRLYEGDRVEVYRPLTIDPKEARRLRAAAVRRRRKGDAARVAG